MIITHRGNRDFYTLVTEIDQLNINQEEYHLETLFVFDCYSNMNQFPSSSIFDYNNKSKRGLKVLLSYM